MECFNCGAPLTREDVCPYCGADIRTYRRVIARSHSLYNEGLRLARGRELSGAIENLKAALACDKYMTSARNLLGLCYYETGETVLALNQWVISKNLQPEDNRVDYYLAQIQGAPGGIDQIRSTMRKFNQAVYYCREGNRDLAKIQLGRVIEMNPKMVKAYQLMALCLIADGRYQEANRHLKAALRIDASDPISTRYLREVRHGLKIAARGESRRVRRQARSGFAAEDIPLEEKKSFLDFLDGSRASLLNILIGMLIGILVCVFLVYPAIQSKHNTETSKALVDVNEKNQASNNSVNALKKENAELQKQLDQYTGKADVSTSYENLLTAQKQVAEEDLEGAAKSIETVNRDLLGATGQADYDAVMNSVNAYVLDSAYKAGHRAYLQGNYAEAVNQFSQMINLDPTHENGCALFELAYSYEKTGDRDNAVKYYEQLISSMPAIKVTDDAREQLDGLGITVNSDNTFTDRNAPAETPAASQDDAATIQENNARLQTD